MVIHTHTHTFKISLTIIIHCHVYYTHFTIYKENNKTNINLQRFPKKYRLVISPESCKVKVISILTDE